MVEVHDTRTVVDMDKKMADSATDTAGDGRQVAPPGLAAKPGKHDGDVKNMNDVSMIRVCSHVQDRKYFLIHH